MMIMIMMMMMMMMMISRCGIPGPGVGYMPQELALYTEFTILETFYYFGRINKMSSSQVYIYRYLVIYNIYLCPCSDPDPDRVPGQAAGPPPRQSHRGHSQRRPAAPGLASGQWSHGDYI